MPSPSLLPVVARVTSLRNDHSLPMSLEFIRTRSYVNDHASHKLEIIGLSDMENLKNKHLLIIEDIIDTGATMVELKKELAQYQPKSVRVVSLFTKRRTDKNCVFKPDYSGFEIPDHFVVGYALVREKGVPSFDILVTCHCILVGLQRVLS